MLGVPLPKKRVALRASPGLAAVRLAAMLVCWRENGFASVGEGRRGRYGNAICEEKRSQRYAIFGGAVKLNGIE